MISDKAQAEVERREKIRIDYLEEVRFVNHHRVCPRCSGPVKGWLFIVRCDACNLKWGKT